MRSVILKIKKSGPRLADLIADLPEDIDSLEIHSQVDTSINLQKIKQLRSLSLIMPQLHVVDNLNQILPTLEVLKIKSTNSKILEKIESEKILHLTINSGLGNLLLKTPQLKTLNLSDNNLASLDGVFSHLTRINLDNNQFKQIPSIVWNAKSLLHLSIDSNPLDESERQKLFDQFKLWFS